MTVPKDKDKDKRSLRERIVDLMPSLRLRTNAGEDGSMSDGELRNRIDTALRAVEPGYWGIDDVFQEQSLVVYAVAPEDKWELYQRGYTLDADNMVTLNDDRVKVEPTLIYKPTPTATDAHPPQPPTAAASSCGCATTNGGNSMTKDQRIAALITNSKGRFTDADKTWLNAVPEDRLAALEQNSDAGSGPKGDKIPDAPTGGNQGGTRNDPPNPNPPKKEDPPSDRQASAGPKTAEEYFSTMPPAMADSIRQGMRIAEQRKASSIKALKDTGRCKLSDADLNAKTQDDLDQLVELAGIKMTPQAVDFSAQGPRALEQNSNENNEPPKAPNFYETVRTANANRK